MFSRVDVFSSPFDCDANPFLCEDLPVIEPLCSFFDVVKFDII